MEKMGITDIHTHILYGVDDGAEYLGDSMKLIAEEWDQGVQRIILTPHYGPKFGHRIVTFWNSDFMK